MNSGRGPLNSIFEHTFEIRSGIRRVLAEMVNAETGIRGYLLSRRQPFLQPYEKTLQELPAMRADLHRLVQGYPGETARLIRVESLISRALDDMQRSRTETAQGNQQGALAALEADKYTMDALRGELSAMLADADHLLAAAGSRRGRWNAALPW